MGLRWFTTKSVGAILGVTPIQVNIWCNEGKMRFRSCRTKIGNFTSMQKRIPETAVAEFLEEYWRPDPAKHPRAKPITLDHLLEWGVRTGSIKRLVEEPDVPAPWIVQTEKVKARQLAALRKAAAVRGIPGPGEASGAKNASNAKKGNAGDSKKSQEGSESSPKKAG
jgi:hypothetical protein